MKLYHFVVISLKEHNVSSQPRSLTMWLSHMTVQNIVVTPQSSSCRLSLECATAYTSH